MKKLILVLILGVGWPVIGQCSEESSSKSETTSQYSVSDPIQAIIDAWPPSHQNPHLDLASLALEARHKGISIDRLKPVWEKQRDLSRQRPGIFSRLHHTYISTSHDEWLGIAILSYLFDDGATAKEILDQGLVFGLWLTGPNEKGNWIDSEWFVYWRPDYAPVMKLAAGREISSLENFALQWNIKLSTTWNLTRVRLLFLDELKWDKLFIKEQMENLGDKYLGRYGNDPLYWGIWNYECTDEKYF